MELVAEDVKKSDVVNYLLYHGVTREESIITKLSGF